MKITRAHKLGTFCDGHVELFTQGPVQFPGFGLGQARVHDVQNLVDAQGTLLNRIADNMHYFSVEVKTGHGVPPNLKMGITFLFCGNPAYVAEFFDPTKYIRGLVVRILSIYFDNPSSNPAGY